MTTEMVYRNVNKTKENRQSLGDRLIASMNKPNQNKIAVMIKSVVAKKIVEKEEYDIKFNVPRMLKIFLYHILFFMFGPLWGAVMSLFEGYQMSKNMGFIGGHLGFVISQSTTSICFMGYLFCSYFLPTKSITYGERVFL